MRMQNPPHPGEILKNVINSMGSDSIDPVERMTASVRQKTARLTLKKFNPIEIQEIDPRVVSAS